MIDPFYVTDSQFYEITKMNFSSATAALQAFRDFGDTICLQHPSATSMLLFESFQHCGVNSAQT